MCKLSFALVPILLSAQQTPSLNDILERLNRVERENAALRQEVEQLRGEISTLKGSPIQPPSVQELSERMEVQERRTEEQAATKVEASQRFPIRLSGMVLSNLFHNGPHSGGNDTPLTASRAVGRQTGGVTFRQSVIGLEFQGPRAFLGAQVKANAFFDFFDTLAETNNYYPIRFRTGGISLDWKTRSLSVVQEKPLFSQRDPTAFSYSGISPLTASGNLWRWQPQVRFEQRAALGPNSQARLQFALIQTSEEAGFDFAGRGLTFERRRPGVEGRFELAHKFDEERRIEIAPGFHASESHVSGQSPGSFLFSVDWFVAPLPKLNFSGDFWTGHNVHHFGALRQAFNVLPDGRIAAVESKGGWGQATVLLTDRLSLNAYAGIHDDRNLDILRTGIAANRSGAVNAIYKIAPNVILSLEALQIRTTYRDIGTRIHNRYDLSVAYLF